ncbi:MAG: SUMF1/EgtB/PvdO family nonheme iron enzyme [Candidatus Aminicenantes bacterium]|nr:MAG: SUMF1/EgtB/PvdO family nonheme iron enzyme [Candidatus Aminicenantes bacterium]
MALESIFVNGDIHQITDSFKSLKSRTHTDWKVYVGYGKVGWWDEHIELRRQEDEKQRQEKLESLKSADDSYPVILEVQKTIEKLLELRDMNDFTGIRQCLKDLIDLELTHGRIFFEKRFIDETIVFLDESVLGEIKNFKDCQAFIRQLSVIIYNSPAFYKGHLISCNEKLLEAKEEYQRKEKLEALNRRIKFGLQKDDYVYALHFIKEAQKYLEEQEANKYLKEKTNLIFSGNQCNKAEELTNKISDLEADHQYKEAFQFLKQLHALNPYSTRVKARCQDYENYIFLDEAIPVDKDVDEIPGKIKENINILQELPYHLRSALNKKLKVLINNVRRKSLAEAKKKRFDPAIEHLNHAYLIEFDSSRQNLVRTEMDRVLFQRKIYKFTKALISTAAAAAIIGVIYVLIAQISSCYNKREMDDHINQAQVLFRENKYEQLKETLNQLSGTARKIKDIKRIADIKDLYELLFIKLRMRVEEHEKKREYDEAVKYAEMAKEFAVIGKRFVIKGLPENLPTQWTRGYEGLIKRLYYKKFFQLGNLDYKHKRYDSAIKNFDTAQKYIYTKEVERLLKEVNYKKYFEIGRSYLRQNDYNKALRNFILAKRYKSTTEVDARISEAKNGPLIQMLTKNFETLKNSKYTEDALKTLIGIKRLKKEPYNPVDLLLQVSYQNSHGYPEIVIRNIPFVFIKGGEFEMGCFDLEDQSLLHDAPIHRVRLSSFWISKTEIREEQYDRYCKKPNFPVNNISWTYAYDFSRRFLYWFKRYEPQFELNSNLPTEAQWEYAARNGGKKTIYPWGDEINCPKANYSSCGRQLKPVAQHEPNKFGVFDLSGNVREWCRDVYNEYYYSQSPLINPLNFQGGSKRVVRGGSFVDNPITLKTYVRWYLGQEEKDNRTGFRIVLENNQ